MGRTGFLLAFWFVSATSAVSSADRRGAAPELTAAVGRLKLPFAGSATCTVDPERGGALAEDCRDAFEIFEAGGPHTLLVRAHDGRQRVLHFVVDDRAPVVTFAAAGDGRVEFQVVDPPADDAGHAAGVARVTCALYAAPVGDRPPAPVVPASECASGEFRYSGLQPGRYSLVVETADQLGNASGPYYQREFSVRRIEKSTNARNP